jgi:hypothetical protein
MAAYSTGVDTRQQGRSTNQSPSRSSTMSTSLPRSSRRSLAPSALIVVALLAAACSNAPTAPAVETSSLTGVAAFNAAALNRKDLTVTVSGTVSQTFPTAAVTFAMQGSLLYSPAGPGSGSFAATGTVNGFPFSAAFVARCVAMTRIGNALHIYVDGTDPVNGKSYAYLVDDPQGDQAWSGALDDFTPTCVVPSIVNTFGNPVPVAGLWRPITGGEVTVRVAR